MFIYRSKQKTDINHVIETVCNAKEELEPLTEEDVFKLPQLRIKVSKSMSEIVGLKGEIQQQEDKIQIVDCVESIDLEILGQPHRQRMDILVLSIPEEDKPSLQSRRMAVRGPFWFILKKK